MEQLKGDLHSYVFFELDGRSKQNYWKDPRCRLANCECHHDYTLNGFNLQVTGIKEIEPFDQLRWMRDYEWLIENGHRELPYIKGGIYSVACQNLGAARTKQLTTMPDKPIAIDTKSTLKDNLVLFDIDNTNFDHPVEPKIKASGDEKAVYDGERPLRRDLLDKILINTGDDNLVHL